MALIFAVSSIEVQVPAVRHFPLRDKGVHFLEYAILGWLCAGAALQTWSEKPARYAAGLAIAIAAFWGLSDEIHQAFVPGRSSEVADFVADALGSVFGVGGHHLMRSARKAS